VKAWLFQFIIIFVTEHSVQIGYLWAITFTETYLNIYVQKYAEIIISKDMKQQLKLQLEVLNELNRGQKKKIKYNFSFLF